VETITSLQWIESNAESSEGVMSLPFGKVFCTMEALYAFAQALDEEPSEFLARHASGDWGEQSESDRQANEQAVENGLRVLSAYTLRAGARIWILSEADRSVTKILLPSEY